MSAWTAERLDALPEGTVIDVEWSSYVERLAKPAPGKWWAVNLGDLPEQCDTSSEDLAGNPNVKSIRVASVPVAALLNDETFDSVGDAASDWILSDTPGNPCFPEHIIRAAIAHVTGEAP